MREGIRLEGITGRPRHAAVFEIKERIDAAGGCVTDHQQFSNRLLRLTFEIAAERLDALLRGLEAAGLSLTRTTVESSIAAAQRAAADAPDVCMTGTLAIRFMSDEPDLRVPVPPIPG